MTLTNRERFISEMTNNIFKPTVFTTGAFIAPLEIAGEMRWVVTGFEDDTYFNGQYLDVQERGATLEDLVLEDDEVEDESGERTAEDDTAEVCEWCDGKGYAMATVEPTTDNPGGVRREIQRCDLCAYFESDEQARQFVESHGDGEDDDDDSELAVCIGCGRTLAPDEAHNEVKGGTQCEFCHNISS
jgi:hypothetical protein